MIELMNLSLSEQYSRIPEEDFKQPRGVLQAEYSFYKDSLFF